MEESWSNMDVIIRKATLNDVKSLISMANELTLYHQLLSKNNTDQQVYLKKAGNFDKMWKKWIVKNIKSHNSLVLVAEADLKLVAYSISLIKQNVPVYNLRRIGSLNDFYVTPEYRGTGITSMFKNKAIKWFKGKGVKYVSIPLHKSNKKAYRIYRNWGFDDYSIEMRKRI